MYFIQEGFIGIGYSILGPCPKNGLQSRPYKFGKTQLGTQIICDHYVINKLNSQFIYAAIKESKGMAIKKTYLHDFVFKKYPDFMASV